MKIGNILVLAAVVGGGYFIWREIQKLKDLGGKATDAVATSIASLWLKLFPLPASMELLGNVKFPGNILVPIQQLSKENAVRHSPDPNFAVYVQYADHLWQLQPRNSSGNWPAVLVK